VFKVNTWVNQVHLGRSEYQCKELLYISILKLATMSLGAAAWLSLTECPSRSVFDGMSLTKSCFVTVDESSRQAE
jgi:hypothetical protein